MSTPSSTTSTSTGLSWARIKDRSYYYALLMRMNRPIGTYLLLWPTVWALWIAGQGNPDWHVTLVFVLGVVLMRSAGCVINDYADRDFDPHVARTHNRPIPAGQVTPREALVLFVVLCLSAFALVLTMNWLTIGLSVFVFGFILQQVLHHVLSGPFLKMVNTARAFSNGDDSVRFNDTRNDEFGYLAGFINNAIESILTTQTQLKAALKRAEKSEIELSHQKEKAEKLWEKAERLTSEHASGRTGLKTSSAASVSHVGASGNTRASSLQRGFPFPLL